MWIVQRLAKIVALAVALLCINIVGQGSAHAEAGDLSTHKVPALPDTVVTGSSPIKPATASKPFRLRCRLYCGCTPLATRAAGAIQQ